MSFFERKRKTIVLGYKSAISNVINSMFDDVESCLKKGMTSEEVDKVISKFYEKRSCYDKDEDESYEGVTGIHCVGNVWRKGMGGDGSCICLTDDDCDEETFIVDDKHMSRYAFVFEITPYAYWLRDDAVGPFEQLSDGSNYMYFGQFWFSCGVQENFKKVFKDIREDIDSLVKRRVHKINKYFGFNWECEHFSIEDLYDEEENGMFFTIAFK